MTFRVLATDYDGTLATDGRVDEMTGDALRRAREADIRLVLVTGRQHADLHDVFEQVDLFHQVVAENGAVLYQPMPGSVEMLAPAPPPALLEALAAESVPISVGQSIVATVEPYQHQLLRAIHDLGIGWHVIFNKGCVMALPANITKASGLASALGALGATHEETVGVGDAENDQALLRSCGLAVAVANALPSVKAIADLVMTQARGAGVTELIDRWLAGDLDALVARTQPSLRR